MLVDDATVEIENVHRNLDMGKHMEKAILGWGPEQVALPAFVSTLSICIVFCAGYISNRASRSLFVPLGMAVVFAMLASYGLPGQLCRSCPKHCLRTSMKIRRKYKGKKPSSLGYL